jgi:hypothetical protein
MRRTLLPKTAHRSINVCFLPKFDQLWNRIRALLPLLPLLDHPVQRELVLLLHAKLVGRAKQGYVGAYIKGSLILTASKCSGARPQCRSCEQKSIECHYVTKSEETRSQALKRQVKEFKQQQSLTNPYADLIELFRTMEREEVMKILPRLQAGESVEIILNLIKAGDLVLQLRTVPESRLRYDLPYSKVMPGGLLSSSSPYFGSIIYQATWSGSDSGLTTSQQYQSRYLKPYHAATLFEPNLFNTKPSKWTNVSRDDELMRDLLAAYFSREHHLFPVFHKDYFLQDMATGQSDCCSSLLVNAILAYSFVCLRDVWSTLK